MQMWKKSEGPLTIGVDLGDKRSQVCVLDRHGEVVWEQSVATTAAALKKLFAPAPATLVVMEVGTHSPWVSRWVASEGHEVIVANARDIEYVTRSSRKSDRVDAEILARLARADPKLLHPVKHRAEQAQVDLTVIRARATLIEARTQLINSARGLAKAQGERLSKCDADKVGPVLVDGYSAGLQQALQPVLEAVAELTAKIAVYNEKIKRLAAESYPEVALLRQVPGVGPLVGLTYVLTIDDAGRFRRSREVGAYLGLRPRQRQSGASRPQLRITKEGDRYLRWLLVEAAHCLLKQNARDTDLKRWGQRLAERGGDNARKRAVVAVARKLAVLLHKLWVNGEVYDPLYVSRLSSQSEAA